jgi:anti-sigma B factor antagonist
VVLSVAGDLDMASAGDLDSALAGAASKASGGPVVLDLSELEFIDSIGLRIVLLAHRRATSDGSGLVIVRSRSDDVTRLFEIAGVGELRFADDLSQAVDDLSQPRAARLT